MCSDAHSITLSECVYMCTYCSKPLTKTHYQCKWMLNEAEYICISEGLIYIYSMRCIALCHVYIYSTRCIALCHVYIYSTRCITLCHVYVFYSSFNDFSLFRCQERHLCKSALFCKSALSFGWKVKIVHTVTTLSFSEELFLLWFMKHVLSSVWLGLFLLSVLFKCTNVLNIKEKDTFK